MSVYYIFLRELRSYFQSFVAYVLIAIFLLLAGYFLYSDLIKYFIFSMSKLEFGRVWEFYFNDLRYVLLIILPPLTMRLFAEEKKLGTIELLWTYPLRDWELLAGKYLASLSIFLLMLALTLITPVIFNLSYDSAVTPLWAGYLGLLLLGSSFITCGMFVSSLTENQIVAAVGTYAVLVMFWSLTYNESIANAEVLNFLFRFSLFDRLLTFRRGGIDIKDIIFFFNFHVVFITLTMFSLSTRRWRGMK